MIRTVYKYKLAMEPNAAAPSVLKVGGGFQPLSVQMQDGELTMWAEVDGDSSAEELFWYFIVGTGWSVPQGFGLHHHVATVQDPPYVWHVYRVLGGNL